MSLLVRMSRTSQVSATSPVHTLEFSRLANETSAEGFLEKLVNTLGVVYVTSVTRDGCSGCAEQKPLFVELATKMNAKHTGLVDFSNIHVRYSEENPSESPRAKMALRHAAYPTYMINVRSRFGPLELYRAIYPSMENLEKQVEEALDLAEYYKMEAEKTK